MLQRARAIEASAFVISAAQVGTHQDGRETYGHSLVIDPWGEVLLDMGGEAAGLSFAELDPALAVGDVVPLGWHVEHVRALDPLLETA